MFYDYNVLFSSLYNFLRRGGLYLIWSDIEEWQEGDLLHWSYDLSKLCLYWTVCGHMWKIHHGSWKSVISSASCEKSYLKTATDGSAGIKWHLRTAAFGWMPTRCFLVFMCLCVRARVWQCVSTRTGLHMCTLMHAFTRAFQHFTGFCLLKDTRIHSCAQRYTFKTECRVETYNGNTSLWLFKGAISVKRQREDKSLRYRQRVCRQRDRDTQKVWAIKCAKPSVQ